jgi:hypothetical protein
MLFENFDSRSPENPAQQIALEIRVLSSKSKLNCVLFNSSIANIKRSHFCRKIGVLKDSSKKLPELGEAVSDTVISPGRVNPWNQGLVPFLADKVKATE